MTKTTLLLAVLLALPTAFAQSPAPPPTASPGTTASAKPEPPALTKFSLDFSGGTPKQLVAAIEKAMGKPLKYFAANPCAIAASLQISEKAVESRLTRVRLKLKAETLNGLKHESRA